MFPVTLLLAAALAQQPPAPQPFPRPGTSRPAPAAPDQPAPAPDAPKQPATAPPAPSAPGEAQMGVRLYPGAQFLASYDAGRGQRYYLFGSTASFVDVVTFYR